MTEIENESGRIVIYGETEKKENNRTLIAFSAASGRMETWVPNVALEATIRLPDGDNAFILTDTDMGGGTFNASQIFSGPREPVAPLMTNQLRETVTKMVAEGVAEANIRLWLNEHEQQSAESPSLFAIAGDSVLETTPAPVVAESLFDMAGEQQPPATSTVDPDSDENDDSTPKTNFKEATAVKEIAQAQTGVTQLQPVVKWVDAFDHEGNPIKKAEVIDLSDTAWGGALLQGDRYEKSVPWRFEAEKQPVWVRTSYDPVTGEGTFARVNKGDGNPASYVLLNPAMSTENRGAGAWLGNVGSGYHVLDHKVVFDPIMAYAKSEGVKAWVTSYNDGKQARLDLDVSQATQTRQAAAQRLRENGHSFLNQSGLEGMINKVDGLYKFGFAINNGVDGKSALHIDMMSLRVYCTNLAAVGGIESIARLRHMSGVMSDIDWDAWGKSMVDVVAEAQGWLATTELMSWIPMDTQLFERLQTLAEKHKLMSWPTVTWGKDKTAGANIGKGYMWRVLGQGWLDHDAPHVKVSHDQKETMYHALQTFTGAYTHKPEWKSSDGKQVMKGHSMGFDTLRRRLHGVSNMFDGMVQSGLKGYMKAANVEKLDLGMKDDCMHFITEHPEVIMVPNKKGVATNESLIEVPTASYVLGLSDVI
jgi:hypothetical protein